MSSLNDRKQENLQTKRTQTLINFFNTKYSVVYNAAKQLGMTIAQSNDSVASFFDWDFKWTDVSLGAEPIKRMNKLQRINYFIGISSIARKNLLTLNLRSMRKYFPDEYDFFPKSFLFPADSKKILQFQRQNLKANKKITFIVKPQASCQGKGIYLCQNFFQIDSQSKAIVQEYISTPMLYEGLKFDFRVYVLLKNISPLEIYLYREGLVRFATEKYEEPSQNNIDDLCLHLTNYAINKHNPKYQFNQTMSDLNFGHKKSLAQFFKSLSALGCNTYRIWRQIKQCIIKTIISVQPHLHSQYRKAQPRNQNQSLCYQVLGFDFMLNDEKKVYLLEVNQSPSFSTETPLDFLVKNFLIKDTLKIVMHDKERKKINLQLRSKRVKTETKESNNQLKTLRTKETIDYEIPSTVLGNYERIFPVSDARTQKLYEKMLQAIKADYHKGSIEQVSGEVNYDNLVDVSGYTPELKINSRKEISFKSIHSLKRQGQLKQKIKQKIKLLRLPNETSNPKIYANQKRRMQSLRKDYLLSKSLDKSITETSYVLQSLSTIKTKHIRNKSNSINQPLPAVRGENLKKGIKNRPQNLTEIHVQTDLDSLNYPSQNFITLKKSHPLLKELNKKIHIKPKTSEQMINLIRKKEKNNTSNTNHHELKLSYYDWKNGFEKGDIRSHLKKYTHFLNPLEKASGHRIQTEDTIKTITENDPQ